MKISFFFYDGHRQSSGGLLGLGGAHPLALRFHVALLGFLVLGEIFADILDVEERP